MRATLSEDRGRAPPLTGRGRTALVSRLGRLDLAVVVAAELRVAVWALGGLVERHEAQLRDRQPGAQDDRHAVEVRDLQGERAGEAWIDEAGGRVDDEAEPAEAGLALDAGDDVGRQL